jgi:hypothetical protein
MSDDKYDRTLELVQQQSQTISQLSEELTQLTKGVAPLMQQQKRLLGELANMRADDGVLLAIVLRMDGTLSGLVNEVSAMHDHRFDRRLRDLEEKAELVNKLPALPSAAGPEEAKRTVTRRFTLEVTMDTVAFDDGRRAELARILNDVSGEAATGIEGGDRPLRDSDGNVVGHYTGMPE